MENENDESRKLEDLIDKIKQRWEYDRLKRDLKYYYDTNEVRYKLNTKQEILLCLSLEEKHYSRPKIAEIAGIKLDHLSSYFSRGLTKATNLLYEEKRGFENDPREFKPDTLRHAYENLGYLNSFEQQKIERKQKRIESEYGDKWNYNFNILKEYSLYLPEKYPVHFKEIPEIILTRIIFQFLKKK